MFSVFSLPHKRLLSFRTFNKNPTMTKLFFLSTCLVGLIVPEIISSTDLKAVVTERGLLTIRNIFLQKLRDEANDAVEDLPNTNFRVSERIKLLFCRARLGLALEDGSLDSVTVASVDLSLRPETNSVAVSTRLSAEFSGKIAWSARCGRFVSYSDDADFTVTVRNADFHLAVSPQFQNNLPSASLSDCRLEINDGSIQLRFGHNDRIFNKVARASRLDNRLRDLMQGELTKQGCKILEKAVLKVNSEIQRIPFQVRLPEDLGHLHWAFSAPGIVAKRDRVELLTFGTVVPNGMTLEEVLTSLPEQPSEMQQTLVDPTRDVTLLMDGTLLNSALLAAARAGHLSAPVPAEHVPSALAPNSIVRTAAAVVCPAIPSDMPLKVAVRVPSDSPPRVLFHEDGATITLRAFVDIKDGSSDYLVMTLSSDAVLTVSLSVSRSERIHFVGSDLRQNLTLDNCPACEEEEEEEVGGFTGFFSSIVSFFGVECGENVKDMVEILEPVFSATILDLMNVIGGEGIRIPRIPDAELRNPQIRFGEGIVGIVTDIWTDL